MGIIKDSDKPLIKDKLSSMKSEVVLNFFTQDMECDFCQESRELLEELSAIGDKIKLRIFDFKADQAEVGKYKISKIPAVVVENEKDYGIRFYGIPAGYEFSSLLEAILMVSRGESDLSPAGKEIIRNIQSPVHLQVFVTPT
jgi:glutaredoxin-like protein